MPDDEINIEEVPDSRTPGEIEGGQISPRHMLPLIGLTSDSTFHLPSRMNMS